MGSEGSSHLNNSMIAILRQTQAARTTREAARKNKLNPFCPVNGTAAGNIHTKSSAQAAAPAGPTALKVISPDFPAVSPS